VPSAPAPAVDLGFGKIGSNGLAPRFLACGLLTSGSSAEFSLLNAPPQAPSALLISLSSTPTRLFGGTVVPIPLLNFFVVVTDKEGKIEFAVPGGSGVFSIFGQFLVRDSGTPSGIGISNALRIDSQR
jgi:hypothetical protein